MIDRKKVIKALEDAYVTDGVIKMSIQVRDVLVAMLKEQEPKIGHWIFESKYCEAWSHTCSECGKRMTTYVGKYASFCWNCGAKMTDVNSSSSETPNSQKAVK